MTGLGPTAPPAVNAFNDIEPLSRLDIGEASRLALDRLGCLCALELMLERDVLRPELGNLRVLAPNEFSLVEVRAKRPRVEKSDQRDEPQQDKPARAQPLPPAMGARGSSGLRSLPPGGHGLEKF